MNDVTLQGLMPIWPELFVAVAGMILLIVGVLNKTDKATRTINRAVIGVFAIVFLMILAQSPSEGAILNGMIIQNDFTIFVKALIAIGVMASLGMSYRYLQAEQILKFEYPMLALFATLGMMVMVSANDMLALYVGLELQSLSLYVLASIRRHHVKSAESGMKYFILGAISSGMLLFGISMIYGFTGSTNFNLISATLMQETHLGAVLGMVFILAGLAFKISAAPFHMWTPDVYEGAPTSVTAFFAIVPKLAAMGLLINVLYVPFAALNDQWFQMVWLLSAASMAVGAFAALRQDNIKRLIAYSSIGNIGYALIGIAAGGEAGVSATLLYLTLYMAMTIGTFGIILCMRRNDLATDSISDLAGLSQNHPWLAYPLAILMFSMSGIPPMAGFFGKMIIFQAAMQSGLYILAVFGVVMSVVAAYYYIRIIKVMFFDEPAEKLDTDQIDWPRKVLIGLSLAIVVLFIFFPSVLVTLSQDAAGGLFP